MSSIHQLPSKFTTATLFLVFSVLANFIFFNCFFSLFLKVNFDLVTHFASGMLLCILIPQQNHQISCYLYLACCSPSAMLLCILIRQQNHETNMPNWRFRRLPKTMKKACRLKPSKSLSLQALRLQAPQPPHLSSCFTWGGMGCLKKEPVLRSDVEE